MIMVIGAGGGVAGSWKFVTAAVLPSAVAKNTMLAITETAPTTIYVADSEPATPAANDVWYHVFNPDSGLAMSDGSVPIRCLGAYRYNGTGAAWELIPAYYAFLGTWWELPGIPPIGTSLQNCTWAQIDRIGQAGKGADYFIVGQTKSVTLTTGETIQLCLIGMNHDQLADGSGGFAPFTFHMVDCLQATGQINATVSNANGWNGCAMRNTCNNTYFGILPQDLQAVVKTVQKRASAGNQSAAILTSHDRIWLAAEIEIFGTAAYARTGEGSQYAYYANSGVRIKNVAGTASTWWARSPNGSHQSTFCAVTAAGASNHYNASTLFGVALGLCV